MGSDRQSHSNVTIYNLFLEMRCGRAEHVVSTSGPVGPCVEVDKYQLMSNSYREKKRKELNVDENVIKHSNWL